MLILVVGMVLIAVSISVPVGAVGDLALVVVLAAAVVLLIGVVFLAASPARCSAPRTWRCGDADALPRMAWSCRRPLGPTWYWWGWISTRPKPITFSASRSNGRTMPQGRRTGYGMTSFSQPTMRPRAARDAGQKPDPALFGSDQNPFQEFLRGDYTVTQAWRTPTGSSLRAEPLTTSWPWQR